MNDVIVATGSPVLSQRYSLRSRDADHSQMSLYAVQPGLATAPWRLTAETVTQRRRQSTTSNDTAAFWRHFKTCFVAK